ncbi:MAG: hypothetical protein AB7G06_09365 [Bdellovibrionales bacterium]
MKTSTKFWIAAGGLSAISLIILVGGSLAEEKRQTDAFYEAMGRENTRAIQDDLAAADYEPPPQGATYYEAPIIDDFAGEGAERPEPSEHIPGRNIPEYD